MKKILFVHYSLVCGGVETALFNLCSMMSKEKYEITVLEFRDWGKNNVLKRQFLEAGMRVISPYYELEPGKSIFHKAFNVVKQECITYKLNRKEEVFIKEAFDVIVYYQVTPIRVRCQSSPCIITYIHGDISTNLPYREEILRQKGRIMNSERIVCVSNLAKESLKRIAGIDKNTIAIFNPINSEKILTLSKEKIIERFERPYICAVGRLSPEKRFDGLVRIHSNLLKRGVLHDLVIIGEGDERAKIESVILETNTADSVHLLGFRENPYPYMKNSMFVVCSSDTEGLPVISMEALLLGKPVVSSYPTVGELFGENNCGLITDIDLASLEEGIYRMLVDKAFYRQCVDEAIARSEYFDSSRMIKQVEDMLDDVLRGNE